MCMCVGTDNEEAVIKSVLDNPTHLKVDCLTKSTFARLMFTESRRLSNLQIAESLRWNIKVWEAL